jgi:hypothetical protein
LLQEKQNKATWIKTSANTTWTFVHFFFAASCFLKFRSVTRILYFTASFTLTGSTCCSPETRINSSMSFLDGTFSPCSMVSRKYAQRVWVSLSEKNLKNKQISSYRKVYLHFGIWIQDPVLLDPWIRIQDEFFLDPGSRIQPIYLREICWFKILIFSFNSNFCFTSLKSEIIFHFLN